MIPKFKVGEQVLVNWSLKKQFMATIKSSGSYIGGTKIVYICVPITDDDYNDYLCDENMLSKIPELTPEEWFNIKKIQNEK